MLASPRSSLVTRLAGLAAVATLAALGACNPYDPDLGDSPFRCGTSDPKCPDGYECMVYSDTLQLCERGADTSSPDARIDGSGLTCNDDSSVEPNDDINTAWTTPIPSRPSSRIGAQSAVRTTSGNTVWRQNVRLASW